MSLRSQPTPTGRKGFNVSLDVETVHLIEVIAGLGSGDRSDFLRDLIEDGMERRFGRNWRQIARIARDQVLTDVDAEAIAVPA